MFLQKIIHSKFGSYMIAIIFGLGLASLFRPACSGENCYEFIGPSNKQVEPEVFKFNDMCYRFQPQATTCNKNMKTLHFSSLDSIEKTTDSKPKSLLTKIMNSNK